MARRSRTSGGRRPQRELPESSDVDSDCAPRVEPYPMARRDSLVSSDSSRDTDDSSEFTPTDVSSAGTSFVSASEASSTVDYRRAYREEPEEELEEELMETGSVESKKSVIGGWFDYACGWMDRPTLCVGGPPDGRNSSLLRESKMKAVQAIRNVKMNEKLSEAARQVTENRESKTQQEVEQIAREIQEAAEAAAAVVQMENKEKARSNQAENQAEPQELQQQNSVDSAQRSHEEADDEIEEKMRLVSERASEIMKISSEAESFPSEGHKTVEERAPASENELAEQDSFHEQLRQKVIDTMAEENNGENPEYHNPQLVVLTGAQPPVNGEIVHLEGFRGPEDEDIHSTLEGQPAVTDLTHIEEQDIPPSPPSYDENGAPIRRRTAQVQPDNNLTQVIDVNDMTPSARTSNYTFDMVNTTDELMPATEKQNIDNQVINLWEEEERKLEEKHNAKIPLASSYTEDAREDLGAARNRRYAEVGTPERARPPRSISRRRALEPELLDEPSSRPIMNRLSRRAHSPIIRRQLGSEEPRSMTPDPGTPPRSTSRQGYDVSLELRRRAMALQPRGLGDHYDLDASERSNRTSVNLVAVRSIDEAQRVRRPRKAFNDKTVHPSKQRKEATLMQYGVNSAQSHDDPIHVEHYSTEPKAAEDHTGDKRPTFIAREMEDLHSPLRLHHLGTISGESNQERASSRARETSNNYSSLVVNRTSRPRERHYDFVDVSSMVGTTERMQTAGQSRSRSRGHDMRDDQDTDFNGAQESSGQHPRTRSRRRDLMPSETSPSDELRSLEKRIAKQLGHGKQEQEGNQAWDEHSVMSSKHLRNLEKKLVQTLKKEDEKRAAKLRRLRTRKQNRKPPASEVSTVDFAKEEIAQNVVEQEVPPRVVSRERITSDAREGRSKYDQLRVLRQSRPMHKYMHRSTSRGRPSSTLREEAY